jgi:hypothetical protein
MAMAKCGAYEELLDMAYRIAVRSYTHLPQTSRAYYKPPPTTTTTNGGPKSSARSSADLKGDASSARRNQQQEAAVRVAFDATEIIISGVM